VKFDKSSSEEEIVYFLDMALESEDYPNEDGSYFVDFRDYQRATRVAFLWVTSLFTNEEWNYIQTYIQEKLDPKVVVSVIRSDGHFDFDE